MAMLLSDLIAEIIDGTRTAHRNGMFDRETAIARIKATTSVDDERAAELLDANTDTEV